MILSSLITISDWLPLAKQKSTYNFELEMLVNILLKFENLITIVEKVVNNIMKSTVFSAS